MIVSKNLANWQKSKKCGILNKKKGVEMLFSSIDSEIEKLRNQKFTGHIKFGIEKSNIVSITINSRLEKSDIDNTDFERQLKNLCTMKNFYGSIEFDLILGNVERLNYCISINGQNLKDRLGEF